MNVFGFDASIRTRLLIPTIGFAISIIVALGVLFWVEYSASHDRVSAKVEQYELAVRTNFQRQIDKTESFVQLVAVNKLVTEGLQTGDRDQLFNVVKPFRERTSIDVLNIYDANNVLFAQAKPSATFGEYDDLVKWLPEINGDLVTSIRAIKDQYVLASAQRVFDGTSVFGTVVAGYNLDDGFARDLSSASGVPVAIYVGARALATSPRFSSKHAKIVDITMDRKLAGSGVRVAFAVTADDRGGLGNNAWIIFALLIAAAGLSIFVSIQAIGYVGRSEELLREEAFHDSLTGLANRRLFITSLEAAFVARRRNPDRDFGVLYIDINKFKPINDTYGHAAGDIVLQQVAQRILDCTRAGDLGARLGGDEFAILLSRLAKDREETLRVVGRLRERIAQPIDIGGTRIETSASVGLAFPDESLNTSPDAILRAADAEAYIEKARSRVAR